MSNPLITVVTPSYNRPEAIQRAVETVSNQTYPNIEHIIVDDYSETPVSKIINEQNGIYTHIVRHDKNRGANAARNTGIEVAEGKYIAFLDDDDEWNPSKLEKQAQKAQMTDAGAIYSGRFRINENKSICPDQAGNVTEDLLCGNFIGTFSTFMIESDLIDVIGYPDESLPSWQDWDFYLRASQETDIYPVQEPLSYRYSGEHSQISDNHEMKKSVTVPQFREKYGSLAVKYGCEDEFKSAISYNLGWSAARAEEYSEARYHFFNSLRTSPSIYSFLALGLVLGSSLSFKIGITILSYINETQTDKISI